MSSQNHQEQIRKHPREDELESDAEWPQPNESQSTTNWPQKPHTRKTFTCNSASPRPSNRPAPNNCLISDSSQILVQAFERPIWDSIVSEVEANHVGLFVALLSFIITQADLRCRPLEKCKLSKTPRPMPVPLPNFNNSGTLSLTIATRKDLMQHGG